jgi:hypothetical protein
MIDPRPYDDQAAMVVLRDLDGNDRIEAQQVRGVAASHLAIFADWHAMQRGALLSLVIHDGAPFAVLALGHTGQAGVAQAAFLARNHDRWRVSIARAGVRIRRDMPFLCADWGVHRIEARAWSRHPTAGPFLRALGFRAECDMAGFGATGAETFTQYAWVAGRPLAPGATQEN